MTKVYYQLSEAWKVDNEKISSFYDQIIFFLPFSPSMLQHKVLAEIRKLLVSEILVVDTIPPAFNPKL